MIFHQQMVCIAIHSSCSCADSCVAADDPDQPVPPGLEADGNKHEPAENGDASVEAKESDDEDTQSKKENAETPEKVT